MSSKKALDESLTRDIESIMISAAQIQERIQELGSKITHDYRELLGPELANNPPIAIGLLRGAITFMADLTRALSIPIEYDFMQPSSYGQSHEAGPLRLLHDLTQPVVGRHLLVIEDIVDTGQTLSYLKEKLLQRGAASVKLCALLDKPARRQQAVTLDYTGFCIEQDAFLVGYGLDYAERYRNLPYVAALKPQAYQGE